MAKLTSTLLGLTLVTACSASSADAGLFDWFDAPHSYQAPRAAVSYTSPATSNGYSLCGPNGCIIPAVNGPSGTSLRPAAPYGYNVQSPTYNVRTPNQCFPTSAPATTTYYGSTWSGNTSYGNSSYGNAYRSPCATGNCPTTPYAAPYAAPYATPNAVPYQTPVNGNPYFGSC
jgi:hypothetical protein